MSELRINNLCKQQKGDFVFFKTRLSTKFFQIFVIFVFLGVFLAPFVGVRAASLDCRFLHPIMKAMLQEHIIHNTMTTNLEHKTIEQYIKFLDGSKIYFLQSDVNRIKRLLKGVYKNLKKKSCKSLMAVHQIYLNRMRERMEFARAFLGDDYKFNAKEKLLLDSDERSYPKTRSELESFQRTYIHFQIANFKVAEMELDEAKEQVIKRYQRDFNQLNNQTSEKLYANFLYAVARSLDPHSDFLSKERLEDFEMQMRLFFEGIGATLSSQNGYTIIEQLIKGGAAEASGLLEIEDKILAVAQGSKGAFVPIIDMPLNEVVQKIRGPKGTKVRLKILRPKSDNESTAKNFEVTLVRRKINLEENAAQIHYQDQPVRGSKKKKRKIAILNLPSFYLDSRRGGRSAHQDVKKLLEEAKRKKVDGLVLDLSSNGGGSLAEAVKVAGLFFKTGNVVKTRGKTEDSAASELLVDTDPQVIYSGPLVVLTSRFSASASEIVAGALKDYQRAVIAGADHTYGKGSVQSVIQLSKDIGAFKVTIGRFFIPGGSSTQHDGVSSDIVFPSLYSRDDIGEKNLDYSLPPKTISPFLSSSAYIDKGPTAWKRVTKGILARLSNLSQRRVRQSEDFKEVLEDIKKAETRDKVIYIEEILNESSETKEKKEIAKQKRRDSDFRKQEYLNRADIKEVVNITSDLVELLGSKSSHKVSFSF